jgi:hypothetical protein
MWDDTRDSGKGIVETTQTEKTISIRVVKEMGA